MLDLYKNIKRLRESKGLSQEALSKLTGYTDRSSIAKIEKGQVDLQQSKIELFAKALGTTSRELVGGNEDIDASLPSYVIPFTPKYLPLVGETACGEPIYSEETRGVYIQVDKDIKADFCVKAKGDSMINARIHNGDIVFIRKQETVENGEIAVVIIKDEVTLKRVYYYKEQNTLILRPENPMYPEQVYSNEELEQIKILGKAIAFQSFIK